MVVYLLLQLLKIEALTLYLLVLSADIDPDQARQNVKCRALS